jgi:hypothetical protein
MEQRLDYRIRLTLKGLVFCSSSKMEVIPALRAMVTSVQGLRES